MTTPTPHDGAAGEQKPSEQACDVCQGRGYRIFPLGGTRRRKICWKCRRLVCPHCEGTGFDTPHANRWCDFCAGSGLVTPDPSGAPTSEAVYCEICGHPWDRHERMKAATNCKEAAPSSPVAAETGTPRTDAEVAPNDPTGTPGAYVDADFARTLERELAQAKSEVERVKAEAARTKGATDFEIADRDVSIEDMTHRIGALESALATARAQLAEANTSVIDWRGKLVEANKDRDSLRAQLEAVTKAKAELEDSVAKWIDEDRRDLTAALAAAEKALEAFPSAGMDAVGTNDAWVFVKDWEDWIEKREVALTALRAQQPQGGGKEA